MKLIITTLLLSISCLSFSQWIEQNPLPQSYKLNSIYFVDDSVGYAVGAMGTVIKTTDAGDTWTVQLSGTNSNLNSVYFTDINTGYVATNIGTILKTTDGGNTWAIVFTGNQVNSIDFINTSTGFAVGSGGLKIKTIDAGEHWSPLGSDNFAIFYNSMYYVNFLNENIGYIVGTSNFCGECTKQQIIKTIDGGVTWTETLPYLGSFTSGSFPDAVTGYTIGSNLVNGNAVLYKTTDSGTTWAQMSFSLSFPNRFTAIHFIDANTGFVGCGNGEIKKTTDGGQTWIDCGVNSNYINSFAFTDENIGYAVGQNGEILKTSNAGGNLGTQYPDSIDSNSIVYPNPAQNSITIALTRVQQTIKVTITDIIGNKVIDKEFTSQKEVTMDVHQLPCGVYFLQVKADSFINIKKFIKR